MIKTLCLLSLQLPPGPPTRCLQTKVQNAILYYSMALLWNISPLSFARLRTQLLKSTSMLRRRRMLRKSKGITARSGIGRSARSPSYRLRNRRIARVLASLIAHGDTSRMGLWWPRQSPTFTWICQSYEAPSALYHPMINSQRFTINTIRKRANSSSPRQSRFTCLRLRLPIMLNTSTTTAEQRRSSDTRGNSITDISLMETQ